MTDSAHFLESFLGSVLVIILYLAIGTTLIFTFTDIQFGDLDACFNRNSYPKISEIGFTIGIVLISSNLVSSIRKPDLLHVYNYFIEFWLLVTNTLFMMSIMFMLLLLSKIESIANRYALLRENVTSLVIVLTLNVGIMCGIPVYYYYVHYLKKSQVTDTIRNNFSIAEKQPFAMEQMINHAGKELETESVLLYQLVSTIVKLRSNTLDNQFETCEKLAKIVYDKYICGSCKTLTWYEMTHTVSSIKAHIELLEKEIVLKQLQDLTREKIILPMFARMVASQTNSIALVKT